MSVIMSHLFIANIQAWREAIKFAELGNKVLRNAINTTFANSMLFQILLFHLYLKKFVNELVIYPQKK